MFFVGTLPYNTIPRKVHESSPFVKVNGKQEYEMEVIFYSRVLNHKLQHLIHWCEYDVNKHTLQLIKHNQMPWRK
jgi:hypothetical protein